MVESVEEVSQAGKATMALPKTSHKHISAALHLICMVSHVLKVSMDIGARGIAGVLLIDGLQFSVNQR